MDNVFDSLLEILYSSFKVVNMCFSITLEGAWRGTSPRESKTGIPNFCPQGIGERIKPPGCVCTD